MTPTPEEARRDECEAIVRELAENKDLRISSDGSTDPKPIMDRILAVAKPTKKSPLLQIGDDVFGVTFTPTEIVNTWDAGRCDFTDKDAARLFVALAERFGIDDLDDLTASMAPIFGFASGVFRRILDLAKEAT